MENVIKLSEAAALQVKDMMKEAEEENAFLRVAVKGGGCSGLSYGMGFEHELNTDDQEEDHYGIRVLVKTEDADILRGTEIDYKQSLMGNKGWS